MADVKPAEVSAILKEQLSGFRSETELQEVGTVLSVGDGIARVYGLTGVAVVVAVVAGSSFLQLVNAIAQIEAKSKIDFFID